jgi:hypothetical protein
VIHADLTVENVLFIEANAIDHTLVQDDLDGQVQLRARAGRNLTTDEWREIFGDEPYRATCPAHVQSGGSGFVVASDRP